jgi:hypothetical protein
MGVGDPLDRVTRSAVDYIILRPPGSTAASIPTTVGVR